MLHSHYCPACSHVWFCVGKDCLLDFIASIAYPDLPQGRNERRCPPCEALRKLDEARLEELERASGCFDQQ